MITFKIKVDKRIYNYYKQLDKEFKKLMNDLPTFFKNNLKIDKKAKQIFSQNFSSKHYSRDCAGYFEAWPVMDLILHGLAIGYTVGKNEKKYDKDLARLMFLSKELESFTLINGRIPIMKVKTIVFEADGGFTFYTKTNQQSSRMIQKQGHNTAVKAQKAFLKAFNRFQAQKLKSLKTLDSGPKKR